MGLKLFHIAVFLSFAASSAVAQKDPPLIRLTKLAMGPRTSLAATAPMGREVNLLGWLVLNGARFRNSEYPVLAKTLAENYARQGYTSPDSDFTQLSTEPSAQDSHGQIVKGSAICPSPALCGDLTGEVMPFNLNSLL
jgi:hypothetical protein